MKFLEFKSDNVVDIFTGRETITRFYNVQEEMDEYVEAFGFSNLTGIGEKMLFEDDVYYEV